MNLHWLFYLSVGWCFKARLIEAGVTADEPARAVRSSHSSHYSEDDPLYPQLFTCFTERQATVYDQCFSLVSKAMKNDDVTSVASLSDCIDATQQVEVGCSVKMMCEKEYLKHVYLAFSDCYFYQIGQENIGTDPADLESFKAATIAASNLETSQKMGAVADFDACVTSNQSAPHKRFSYRRNDYPDHLRDLFGKLDHVLGLGPVSPPPLVVATDCMESALLLNGCATTSQQLVGELGRKMALKPFMEDRVFQCMSEDHHWFHDICTRSASTHLATRWSFDCVRGGHGTAGDEMNDDDDGCRVKRMKQYRQLTADCFMQKVGAVSTSYFFPQFNKKSPSLLIRIILDRSTLSDGQQADVRASFDACMAINATLPYRMFPYELDDVPGPVVYKAIVAVLEQSYGIGTHPPTMEMRAVDCVFSSLLLNGCDQTTPASTAVKALETLIKVDGILH